MEKTKKILIVEDDENFSWILRENITRAGLTAINAKSGEEGLELAQKEKPDLILIDIQLPKMDGIAMAKAIRAKGIDSKMIFLTQMKDVQHISSAIDAVGEADYIVKSDVHIDAVIDRVKNRLEK